MNAREHRHEPDSPEGLTVKLSHVYKVHRLYVHRPDGSEVGYWDLVANQPHPRDRVDLEVLIQRVKRWKAEHPDQAERWADATADRAQLDIHESGACDCADLPVTYWRKFGLRRLYVNGPDGSAVGYWDLKDDEPHPNNPQDRDRVTHVALLWKSSRGAESETSSERSSSQHGSSADSRSWTVAAGEQSGPKRRRGAQQPGECGEPGDGMWTDLAANPAGAEARKRAREERSDSRLRALWERMRGSNREERNWRIGADGEEAVGRLLDRVARKDPSWRDPLHAVVVGDRGADIDHVFIGSGGVFTINVKHHPGKEIWVSGHKIRVGRRDWGYVAKSLREAETASERLSRACGFTVHVEALIVIVGAKEVTFGGPPANGLHVLDKRHLATWLRERRSVQSDGTVQSVYDAARRSDVWRPPKAA